MKVTERIDATGITQLRELLSSEHIDSGRNWTSNASTDVEQLYEQTIRLVAYFLSEADHSKSCNEDRGPLWYWLEAERIVEEEIRNFAYSSWLGECRRSGYDVYGTDWSHWFEAKKQFLQTEFGRYSESCDIDMSDESAFNKNRENGRLGKECLYGSSSVVRQINSTEGEIIVNKSESNGFDDNEIEVCVDSDSQYHFMKKVDLNADEFVDKIVVTDESAEFILFVGESMEEVYEFLSTSGFQEEFEARFGSEGEWTIHYGRSSIDHGIDLTHDH